MARMYVYGKLKEVDNQKSKEGKKRRGQRGKRRRKKKDEKLVRCLMNGASWSIVCEGGRRADSAGTKNVRKLGKPMRRSSEGKTEGCNGDDRYPTYT